VEFDVELDSESESEDFDLLSFVLLGLELVDILELSELLLSEDDLVSDITEYYGIKEFELYLDDLPLPLKRSINLLHNDDIIM